MLSPSALAERSSPPRDSRFDQESKLGRKSSTIQNGRISSFGNRSVATLSASKLERKRALDRASQRAARQRNRKHIEKLEAHIKKLELSSTNINSAYAKLELKHRELKESLAELQEPLTANVQPSSLDLPILPDPILSDTEKPTTAYFDDYRTQNLYSSTVATVSQRSQFLVNNNNAIPTSFVNQPTTQFWEFPVLLLPPNNEQSATLFTILHDDRREHQHHPIHFLGRPSLRTIMFPDSAPDDSVSVALINLLCSVGITRLPELVACVWQTHTIIQWQLRPCLETYQKMPHWLTPRPSQLSTLHQYWVTMLKFPKLRDKLIERPDLYANDEFLYLYTQSVRFNWPFDDVHPLEVKDGKVSLTDAFAKHAADISNWTVTRPFTRVYPELHSVCSFRDQE